ncbi:putative sulfate exporter family transporter [Campylobacter sp. RM12327]|uniref:YeiH family protein n=1 Tax=Campylobacter sputorum TaxID=206 RepID=UPI000B784A34|nr:MULTISPECIES: putative sulfate exporter family transporter [Campylobacter]ASM39720.1 putative membrane protein, YeiH/YadS family [Campylobacter sputorum]MBE7358080.1 putative sulfate exporter family transporter [Campylobacter sp. RM11302]MBF6668892.1 putative sulfate exporter family transporter [Campylobacter sp. RM12327]MBF6673806.1 putative sulfate exporter family transporter [Campylobacter sp. RM13538]MBF6676290.1 putative sulfate exporter family transporter [Campylobacter sp. RM12321]
MYKNINKVSKKQIAHEKIFKKRKNRAYILLFVLTMCSFGLSKMQPFSTLGLSPLIIAIILGAFFGNIARNLTSLLIRTGVIAISTKQILRLGIIFYGFRITIDDIIYVGAKGVILSACVVFLTFFIGYFIGRALRIEKKLSALIASGSSICGAAAVLATNSVIKGKSEHVGVAICTVVVFGTIGMFAYPILFKMGLFDLDVSHMGVLMGGTLHEVAHAVAAGAAVGGEGANNSVIIKMLRVLMLVPFLIMIGLLSFGDEKEKKKRNLKSSVPYFALWFLVAVGVGSISFFPKFTLPYIELFDTFLLSVAMCALGFTIRKDVLKNAGFKPFLQAIIIAIWLLAFGYFFVKYFI